jgi:hypothetical protein
MATFHTAGSARLGNLPGQYTIHTAHLDTASITIKSKIEAPQRIAGKRVAYRGYLCHWRGSVSLFLLRYIRLTNSVARHEESSRLLKESLGLTTMLAPIVEHRGRAFGLVLEHQSGWKIV